MTMVDVDSSCQLSADSQSVGLVTVALSHDDSTVNIVLDIIIILHIYKH